MKVVPEIYFTQKFRLFFKNNNSYTDIEKVVHIEQFEQVAF